ncbi:uncharacterized protein LOC122060754 [Macadamia integrifolia]|uniref:uncharacterized protein LOC122060754 n=1 Tax=Macadamia integrifolia TaxID=60698 RepID=UPI001C53409F|nr:uncharacterized protein LOC122060754 [Macadamia integrifolia]
MNEESKPSIAYEDRSSICNESFKSKEDVAWNEFDNRIGAFLSEGAQKDLSFGSSSLLHKSLEHATDDVKVSSASLETSDCIAYSPSQKWIKELKLKLEEDNTESNVLAAKEEILISESVDNKVSEQQSQISAAAVELGGSEVAELNQDCYNNTTYGSSHKYSSTILNEDNSPNAAISSSGVFLQYQLMMSPASSSLRFNGSSRSSPSPTSLNSFQFSDLRLISSTAQNNQGEI